MLAPDSNEFGLVIVSHEARPASTWGAAVTPVQNATNGTYATVLAGASVTEDVYGIEIFVHGIAVTTAATDSLTTIGIDPAGGTSFTDYIPNLLTSYASSLGNTLGCGISYYFPVWIKSGTSIGARGSINRGTVGTQRVIVRLHCRPSHPKLLRVGTFVRSFGEDTAASCGTAVTAGTTSEGTFTQLGSAVAAADRELWFWQVACAPINLAAMGNAQVVCDLGIGDASSKKVPIYDQIVAMDSVEANYATYRGAYAKGVSSDLIYTRAQCSFTTTAFSAIAYGVGG